MKNLQIALLLLLCLVLAGVGVLYGVRLHFTKKLLSKMTPQEQQEYEAWHSQPLSFPPEALEAAPFEEETIVAADEFRMEWRQYSKTATDLYGRLREDQEPGGTKGEESELTTPSEELAKIEPLLAAFEHLVAQPDYEIDAVAAGIDPPSSWLVPSPDYFSMRCTATLLALKARELSSQDKDAEALATAELIMRASHTHSYSLLVSQLIGKLIFRVGTTAWHHAVAACDDPELLRHTLQRQNELTPEGPLITREVPIMVLDHVGMIRGVLRYGIPVKIQGRTGQEIMGESFRAQAEFQERIVLPLVQNSASLTENALKSAKQFRTIAASLGGTASGPRALLGWVAAPYVGLVMYSIANPNAQEAYTRDDVVRSLFDLLRLYTAQKLYKLERGKEPGTIEELVPEYLPELPKDPFTDGKHPYRTEPFSYSIGPDRRDQKGAIRYDANNGTISPGDIFLTSPTLR